MHNIKPNNNYGIYGFCIKNIKYCPAILHIKCSSYVLISCKTNTPHQLPDVSVHHRSQKSNEYSLAGFGLVGFLARKLAPSIGC